MERLFKIGFHEVGRVSLHNERVIIELTQLHGAINVLYGFVVDGDLMYIGKSVRPLSDRLYGYQAPGPTQSTNIRVNRKLKDALEVGHPVSIIAFVDDGAAMVGDFHLNSADGLENSIIKTLEPEWNISGLRSSSRRPADGRASAQAREKPPIIQSAGTPLRSHEFEIILAKTYYDSGFFNVPVTYKHLFAGDGAHIDIHLGEGGKAIPGTINRAANLTGAPRIMGGAAMRDWIRRNCKLKGKLRIEVLSPRDIRLTGARQIPGGRKTAKP